jgi:hypothetical protein
LIRRADITRAQHAEALERVLQRQGVDHRGQHAHVIGGHPVHAGLGQTGTAENVAPADHHADLHTQAIEWTSPATRWIMAGSMP